MRFFRILLVAVGLMIPFAATAQNTVVVEMFTSQGCSSCPPADKILKDLNKSDEIIVLGWHVDYWDYLGWKDEFSSPESTARQMGYRERWNLRSLYTPQAVIQGETQVVGSKRREVNMYVDQFGEEMPMIDVTVSFNGEIVSVNISPKATGLPAAKVYLVKIIPTATTQIRRGENAGQTLEYVNIVKDMTLLESWNGTSDIEMQANVSGDDRYVVLVQADNFGPILGAAFVN